MHDSLAIDRLRGANREQGVGNLRAHDLREGRGDEEVGQGLRAVAAREPVREIHDDAGEKAGFHQAEQEANAVELKLSHAQLAVERGVEPLNKAFGGGQFVPHERRERGDETPSDHDAADPFPRAPLLHDERAGNLQQEVAEEEHSRAQADDGVVEARQILRHRELGDGDVRAVHVGDDVANEEQRQQPPVGFAPGTVKRGKNRRAGSIVGHCYDGMKCGRNLARCVGAAQGFVAGRKSFAAQLRPGRCLSTRFRPSVRRGGGRARRVRRCCGLV